ncbi:MAG: hypothetical protein Q7S71_03505, partial [Candidatus Nitrotoga sp.]|nr:hypothetical protein [Candidatus Nitrotoga sp.]
MVPAERPTKIFPRAPEGNSASHPDWGAVPNILSRLFKIPAPPSDTPYLTQDADVLATKHDARIVATELQGILRIPEPDDHTPNTAIVTYKTPDGRTLFIDFMGTLIGLTNEEIRKLAVELEHPDYGFIRILHPTLVLKSRIVNL